MNKIVSLITARGGSKGIPNINIIEINGKPLIWYSINASLHSNVSETWVSTDSKEIANISESFGAKILNGEIPNSLEEAHKFMLNKGKELGLSYVGR